MPTQPGWMRRWAEMVLTFGLLVHSHVLPNAYDRDLQGITIRWHRNIWRIAHPFDKPIICVLHKLGAHLHADLALR